MKTQIKSSFTLADLGQYGSYNYSHSIELVFDTTPIVVGLRRMLVRPDELIYFVTIRAAWSKFLSRRDRSLKPSIMGLGVWGPMVELRAEKLDETVSV